MKHKIIIAFLVAVALVASAVAYGSSARPSAFCALQTVPTLQVGTTVREMQIRGCTVFFVQDVNGKNDPPDLVTIYGTN